MKKLLKRRGQRIAKSVTRITREVGEKSADHIQENLVERVGHIRKVGILVFEWSLLVLAQIALSLTQGFWYASSYAEEAFAKGGTYTEATLGKVSSLNPLYASTSSEKTLSRLMFATLTGTDYSGHTGLGLADSITMDDTARVWIVKLRDGLKWSDGEPLTNEDVIFTINLIADPKTNTNYTSAVSGMSVKEDENGNLVFVSATPNVYFNTALDIPIVPKHILSDTAPELLLEDNFSTTPVTSGAFVFNATQAIGTEGEKIVYLSPNKYYYKGTPLLSSFAIHAYMNTDDIIAAVNSGTVSATAELSSADQEKITSSSIGVRQSSLNYGVYAFFNLSSPALSSAPLRQTIRKGLNLSSLRSNLNGEQPLDYPLVPGQVADLTYPELPEEDFIKARAEIAGILGANSETELKVATINSGYLPSITNNLAGQLKDLGFKVNVEIYEPNQEFILNVLRARAYDVLVYEIGLGSDPDLMVYYHSTQATSSGYNLSNYKDAISNDLIASARATVDPVKRAKKYETFLGRWVNDVPAIGIYQSALTYYVNRNVRTFSTENSLVTATDRFNDVVYWSAEKTSLNRTP